MEIPAQASDLVRWRQFPQSRDKANEVLSIVRTPQNATKLAALAETSSNVHVIQGDLDDVSSLKVK